MNWGFTQGFELELAELDTAFRNSLQPWSDKIESYYEYIKLDDTFIMLPALTVAAFEYMGHEHSTAQAMAKIVKLFYFSSRIQERIKDDEEGQLQDQDLQFSILIGDYILGLVLKLLVNHQVDSLLELFASMMADVNQGLVEKYKQRLDYQEGTIKTRIPIYRTAFLSAARLASADKCEEDRLEKLGYHVGMAVELRSQGSTQGEARGHIRAALDILGQGGRRPEMTGALLQAILRGLHESLCVVDQAAAI